MAQDTPPRARIVEARAQYKTPFRDLEPPLPEALRMDLARQLARGEGEQPTVYVDEDANVLVGHAVYDLLGDRMVVRTVVGLGDLEKEAFILRRTRARADLSPAGKVALRERQRSLAFRMRERDPEKYKQQEIATLLGVGRQTVTDWLGLRDRRRKREPDPEPPMPESVKAERVGEGKGTRFANRNEVYEQVRELSEQRLTIRAIGKRLGMPHGTVQTIRRSLGIRDSDVVPAAEKLWKDIEHIASTLEGAALAIKEKVRELQTTELVAEAKEIKKCKTQLSKANREIRALVAALRAQL